MKAGPNYAIPYMNGVTGKTSGELFVYAEPSDSAKVIAVIPRDEDFDFRTLSYTHALVNKRGWRFAVLNSFKAYYFDSQSLATGYIRTKDLLHVYAFGQGDWIRSVLGRYCLFQEDLIAFQDDAFLSSDYNSVFSPACLVLSVSVFGFSLLIGWTYGTSKKRR